MNIKQTILRIFGKLGQFLSILFADAVRKELEVVMPIAVNAVKTVALDSSILSNPAKRDAAVALIVDELTKAQVQVGSSVIALGVELAVQHMKAAQK